MTFEFDLNLKPVRHKDKPPPKPSKEPGIRKALVTAYQIADYMRLNQIPTLKAFCRHANITPARATQIMRLLQLSPRIQENILLNDPGALAKLTEHNTRMVSKRLLWDEQEVIWDTDVTSAPPIVL